MIDELDIVKTRAPIALPYAIPGFWEGARQARLQIADAEAHERDAQHHRQIADDYRAIAAALSEGRTLEDLSEYAKWRSRTSEIVTKTA